MSETVVVTGGAGFIGSNIAHALLDRGYTVKIIDNLSTGRLENIKEILGEIEFVKGDIRNAALLKKLFRRADYVLHQAALPSVPRSIDNPRAAHDTNITGTFNVLMAARDTGVKKVVFASSSSIYGNRVHFGKQSKVRTQKEMMKPMPLSPYAVNKLVGEEYCKVFSHIFGLPTVCLRYFNVFGPRQNPKSEYAAVIPKFITAIINDDRPVIHGDGEQSRDFTYIANTIEANILAMKSKRAIAGETINVACGDSISLLQLLATINKELNKKIKPKHDAAQPGDVRRSWADIRKAQQFLGYSPLVDFRQGLRRTIEWFRHGVT